MIRVDGNRIIITIDGAETEMVFLSAADAEAFAARASGASSKGEIEALCHTPTTPAQAAPAAQAQVPAAEDIELAEAPQAPAPEPPPATVTATWRPSTRRLTVTLHPVADAVIHRFIDGRPAATPTFNLAAGIDSTRPWTMSPGQTLTLRWGAATGPILFETTIPGS